MSLDGAREFQSRAQSLEDRAKFTSQSANLTGGERPDRVRGAYVTANFFPVFDLKPVLGRTFAPGVGLARAQAEMNTIANQLALAYPAENCGRGAKAEDFREIVVGGVRRMLYLLLAAVGLILLIACANLANPLLARGLSRRREIAAGAVVGVSKRRLIRVKRADQRWRRG